VSIRRATSCEARERIEEKEELKSELSVQSVGENSNPDGTRSVNSVSSVSSVREKESSVREKENSVRSDDFVIDLHFNAHGNPQARGTETIVADDATELELRIASRLAHATADSLEIPLRGIKSESQTPHRRLAMLHLTPQSIILEVCFCTSPEDVEAYRKNREKLAADLAWAIYELL
jgi:N-acetylmuramoyl-L-alanine amidase